nr:hypothetical protein [Tanacetum cinerariifolium]
GGKPRSLGKFHFPTDFVVVDFEADPRVPLILGRSFLRTGHALIDVYGEEITLMVNEESITFNLSQTMRYSSNCDDTLVNRVDVIDVTCEDFVQDVLDFQYNPKSSSPISVSDDLISESDASKVPIVKSSSPTLTPFGESDFFLEEIKDFLNDDSIPTGIENYVYDLEGDILFLEKLLNEDPFQLPLMDLKVAEESKEKSSVEEPPELELKELPSHLEEGTVLGHKISKSGIEVDRAKVDMIAKLPHLTTVKGVRSFLGHAGFYRRFIQDFSKIARPMTHLLEKETPFIFSKEFLGQRKSNHFQPIHYANKTMTEEHIHYTTTEKEMLTVVYAFEKFRPHLVLSRSIVYTDHSALKYLLNKQDAKPRLLRWVLLLQEFDIPILDKKGYENLAADHLSRLENTHHDVLENKDINENFPLETLGSLTSHNTPWKLLKFSKLPMRDLPGAIMVPISQRRRGREKYLREMRCLKTVSKFVRYSIFGYGVTHRLATAYHPQTSGQVEVFNHGLKRILVGTIGENRTSWSYKLDDALWAFRTAYKTPIGCTPYKLVYGKSYHLPIELEHRAYWALKHAYENSVIYKERTKKLHDSKIKNRIFNVGDHVLLFNSHLKIFSRKLKTRWSGPFTITRVFPYGTIELSQPNGSNFKVNGHRVKHYFDGDVPSNVAPDLHTFPMDN